MLSVKSVLFVCMGNICRSPLAEGVFLHLLRERGLADRFTVDSAGTGAWHAGNRPDARALAVATRSGIELPSIARQIRSDDWENFDLIIVMDPDNLADCLDAGAPAEKLHLLRTFDPAINGANLPVPDPYYGGDDGFDEVLEMVTAACAGLIDALTESSVRQRETS